MPPLMQQTGRPGPDPCRVRRSLASVDGNMHNAHADHLAASWDWFRGSTLPVSALNAAALVGSLVLTIQAPNSA